MKLSAVYKSPRKADTYLYVEKRDNFSTVPEVLMKQFGVPIFVMLVALDKRAIVAGMDKTKLVERTHTEGFYLQLPPRPQDLLDMHVQAQ